jgi:hypothetical protein
LQKEYDLRLKGIFWHKGQTMRTLATFVLLLPLSANANFFFTGNEMYEICQTSRPTARTYAAGVLDGASAMEFWETKRVSVCPSNGVTVNQVGDLMCRRLEENPEERNLSAGAIAWNAFYAAWPCPD